MVGLVVCFLVYSYINPFEDPTSGVTIWLIGILFVVWWLFYFIFYTILYHSSDKKLHIISRQSYVASLIVSVYFTVNFLLIILELWSYINGLIILIIFLSVFAILFAVSKDKDDMMNIDHI